MVTEKNSQVEFSKNAYIETALADEQLIIQETEDKLQQTVYKLYLIYQEYTLYIKSKIIVFREILLD